MTLPAAASLRRRGVPYVVQPHGMVVESGNPLARPLDALLTTGDTVEIATADGTVFAKGIVAADAETVESLLGKRSGDLPPDTPAAVVHRDDLVVLP